MKDSGGDCTTVELAELFTVSRPTVYRVLERARARHDGRGEFSAP